MRPTTPRLVFTLAVLLGINTMNFFDRQILGAVQEKIKADWSLSDSKLVARHNNQTFWQTEKPGLEFNRFPDAPEPADSAAKRLVQMKDLARRFKCRLSDINRDSEELRLLPRPLYRYKTERQDLADGALFAFVQGTDPEVVVVIEAARHDGASDWRYAVTRRTGY